MPRSHQQLLNAFTFFAAAGLLASASTTSHGDAASPAPLRRAAPNVKAQDTSAATQQLPAGQKPTTTGNASLGKQLYLDYSCWACHGYNAQTGNGARLLPPRLNQQQFTLYIRAPRTLQMPAYSVKVLTDVDAANIYAYISSLPREPATKDVPLLNQLPR
jgi:mono/diheme cytochrome c family protein